MKVKVSYLLVVRFAACVLSTISLDAVLWGQQTEARAPAVPLVTDWSHQHLVFSNQNETNVSFALQQEPRYWQQRLRRNGTRFLVSDSSSKQTRTHSRRRGTFKRDWSVS